MKTALPLVGILLIGLGIIWVGQGIGVIPGSFMTGVIFWAFAGAVCIVSGAALIGFTVRASRTKR
jgi:uncharacterized membrane protein